MKAITDTDGRRLEVRGGRLKGRDRLLEVVRIGREGRERDGRMWKHLHLHPAEAELGGDVFVIAGVDRFEVQAEAYRCAARERWEGVEWQEVKN